MTTITTTPRALAEGLAEIVGRIMNGEGLPAADSPEFGRFTHMIGEFLKSANESDRALFGTQVMSLLIAAGSAKIQTDIVLRNYGAGAM